MKELTLAIVGIDYPNADKAKTNRRSELKFVGVGAAMHLVLEPKNKEDPHAVAVFSANGIQVGYLTAERAPWIGAKIRAGEEIAAILQGVVGKAGYLRVRIGGGAPTLPDGAVIIDEQPAPTSARVGDDDGFWPEEDGPEWGA